MPKHDKGKGRLPTKKQLLSPKLDGMGFSNDEIMEGILKYKLISDDEMKMIISKKKPDVKPMNKKIRTVKPRALANKGGMMKKKTKYMAKGGMKKTKYMAKGGMKKTKGYARGGAARRR
mgnify:FL=1|jgi:hypothetical protein